MSKTIKDVTLLELLPPNLSGGPNIIAASRAIDKQWQNLANKICEVLTYADIENAASETDKAEKENKPDFDVLDMLAAEMNVDFYDQNLPLDKRLALVKNGYVYKYTKGTAYAVKQVVTDAFDKATTEEWFDYGGDPYHFRITTEASMPSEDIIHQIFKAVRSVQNVRSKLDYLAALKDVGLTNYYGFVMHQSQYHKILQQS